MSLWAKYDRYLQQQAKAASGIGVVGRVQLVVLPFFLGILLARVISEAFGLIGPVGMAVYVVASLLLLAGLFYSGFRFLWWRQRRGQ